jgi:hypothetical protein
MARRNNLEELLHRMTVCAEEGISPKAVDDVRFQLCRLAKQRGMLEEEREFLVALLCRWRDIQPGGYQ